MYVDRLVVEIEDPDSEIPEAARTSLQMIDPATYEFQSEFAKRYLSQGRTEGRAEGEVTLLSKLLTVKFGALDSATVDRLSRASTAEVECWAERILTATTLDEVFR